MLDTRIINGTLVDGTGRPAYRGNVGILHGRIAALGKVAESARRTIDAEGRIVAPGFIDSHTHYDAQVFWDPYLSPSCFHGVTTVLGGNCGFSIAPLTPEAAAYLAPMLARVEGMPLTTLKSAVHWNWDSFGSYLAKLEGTLGINAGFMVGHSAVRRVVMGERAVGHRASPDEIVAMRTMVAQSLREGALGFSSTVSPTHNDADGNPVPSRHASREELLALAGACRDQPGTTLELLPSIDLGADMAQLLVDFSLAGGRSVNWNVLVLQGHDDAQVSEAKRKLAVSDYARSKGAVVMPLSFVSAPTLRLNFWSGFGFDGLPDWAPLFRVAPAARIQHLKDPAYRQFLNQRANSPDAGLSRSMAYWERYRICETFSPDTAVHRGRLIGELALEQGKAPFDTLLDIVVADGLKTVLLLPSGDDSRETFLGRAELWSHPDCIVGASDAGAHMDMIDSFAFTTKLLGKAVREHGVMSLEAGVQALTEKPARMMGLKQRGNLKEGWHADIVIFDAATIGQGEVYTRFDLPGGEGRLYADAVGIEQVLVNGTSVVERGQLTGERPGIVLRSGRDTDTITAY
jgi:N-acyl-D-aspartate/D-glutamate deacylase